MTYGYHPDAASNNNSLGIFWCPFSVLMKGRRQKWNELIVMFVIVILKPSYRRIFGDKKRHSTSATFLEWSVALHVRK